MPPPARDGTAAQTPRNACRPPSHSQKSLPAPYRGTSFSSRDTREILRGVPLPRIRRIAPSDRSSPPNVRPPKLLRSTEIFRIQPHFQSPTRGSIGAAPLASPQSPPPSHPHR